MLKIMTLFLQKIRIPLDKMIKMRQTLKMRKIMSKHKVVTRSVIKRVLKKQMI